MNHCMMMELVYNVNTSVLLVAMIMIVILVSPIVTELILQTVTVMMDIMMMVLTTQFVKHVTTNVPLVPAMMNVQLATELERMLQIVLAQQVHSIMDLPVKIVVLSVLHVLVLQMIVISVKPQEKLTHQLVNALKEHLKMLTKYVNLVLIHVLPVQVLLTVVQHVLELLDSMLQDVLVHLDTMIMAQMKNVKYVLISVNHAKMLPMIVQYVIVLELCQTVIVSMELMMMVQLKIV